MCVRHASQIVHADNVRRKMADRLFASFGQDILDCLFSRSNLMLLSHHVPVTSRTLRPISFFILSVVYTGALHCPVLSFTCSLAVRQSVTHSSSSISSPHSMLPSTPTTTVCSLFWSRISLSRSKAACSKSLKRTTCSRSPAPTLSSGSSLR